MNYERTSKSDQPLKDRQLRKRKRIIEVYIEKCCLGLLLLLLAAYLFTHMSSRNQSVETAALSENLNESSSAASAKQWFTNKNNPVPCPDIDVQLLTVNDNSRPGRKVESINKIVVHYTANPGSTAQDNRDYFESLKSSHETSVSSNFIIGLNGEIIMCVPPDEVAYASNSMNSFSLSIENCHPDNSGIFTDSTYHSCCRLVAFLIKEYGLGREDIIRHYDVTGKECPLYYVENPDQWEKFRDDVISYTEQF